MKLYFTRISVWFVSLLFGINLSVMADNTSFPPCGFSVNSDDYKGESTEWTEMKNRRAMVGNGYEVNKLVDAVGVATAVVDLPNLVDTDLTNAASFGKGVDLGVGTNPIVSIRDMKRVYKKGTEAGFILSAQTGLSVLSLDIIKAMAIGFCREGKLLETVAVEEGQEAGLLGLSLVSIPGSENADIEIKAVSENADFDEVCLMPAGGVGLTAVKDVVIKYAFVGSPKKYYVSNEGAQLYHNNHTGSPEVSINPSFMGTVGLGVPGTKSDLAADNDPQTSAKWVPVLALGLVGGFNWEADVSDQHKTDGISSDYITTETIYQSYIPIGNITEPVVHAYPKGCTVTLDFETGGLLDLSVGSRIDAILVTKYKGNKDLTGYSNSKERLQTETVNAAVLNLGAAKGGRTKVQITALEPFDEIRIRNYTGVKVDLGGISYYDAIISEPIDIDHQCDLALSKVEDPCAGRYQVNSAYKCNMSWTCVECPEGMSANNVTVGTPDGDILYEGVRLVESEKAEAGRYIFEAKADDGCAEQITLHYGSMASKLYSSDKALVNKSGEDAVYVLSDEIHGISGGQLLGVGGDSLDDPENVVSPSLKDYAQYTGGVKLAQNNMIVGVKTKDGSVLPGGVKKRIGFVVEIRGTVLSANLLNFFNVRAYDKDGNLLNEGKTVVDDVDVLSASLIGNEGVRKMRLSVPCELDNISEIQLWTSGVLELDIAKMNIYYAFADDEDVPFDHMRGMEAVSYKNGASLTNAEKYSDESGSASEGSVANVVKVYDNLSFIIDDDPDFKTAATLASPVSAGATTIVVKLGRTYSKDYQVGVVTGTIPGLADVDLINAVSIATGLDGVSNNDKNSKYNVLNAGVISLGGDKELFYIQPEKDFNELVISFAGVDVLDIRKIYGVFVRIDKNRNGVADIVDNNVCGEEFVLDEDAAGSQHKGKTYTNGRMVLHRTFSRSQENSTENNNVWNSIVLPVDLTGVQLRNAFGNYVRLAEAVGLNGDNAATSNLVRFEIVNVPKYDDDVVLKAGRFYIIRTKRLPDVMKGNKYTTTDESYIEKNGTADVAGEVYFIDDVDYDTQLTPTWREYSGNGFYEKTCTGSALDVDNAAEFSVCFNAGTFTDNSTLTLHGTMSRVTGIPAGVYAFTGGNMVRALNPSAMKGFRFWMNDDSAGTGQDAKAFSFCVSDKENGTTSIYHVVNGQQVADGDAIYDIAGRKLNKTDDVKGVRPGVYIIRGKKIVVK